MSWNSHRRAGWVVAWAVGAIAMTATAQAQPGATPVIEPAVAPEALPATPPSPSPPPSPPRPAARQAHDRDEPTRVAPRPLATATPDASPVLTPRPHRSVAFLMRFGVEFGGDKIGEVMSTEGDSRSIEAGGLVSFSGGVFIHPDAPWTIEATLGYKSDTASYKNGDFSFIRIPIDLIGSYRTGNLRIGAGVTVHLAPQVSCNLDGLCNFQINLDNAVGAIVQLAYGVPRGNAGYEFGARFTSITYTGDQIVNEQTGKNELDGSCLGLFVGGWL